MWRVLDQAARTTLGPPYYVKKAKTSFPQLIGRLRPSQIVSKRPCPLSERHGRGLQTAATNFSRPGNLTMGENCYAITRCRGASSIRTRDAKHGQADCQCLLCGIASQARIRHHHLGEVLPLAETWSMDVGVASLVFSALISNRCKTRAKMERAHLTR